MLTLKLFGAVLKKESNELPYVSEDGYVIAPEALWARDRIIRYYREQKLTGNELNATFHKSWSKIVGSSREELILEQIRHYASTYGSNFTGEIYIPVEVLDVPETNLKFKLIEGLSVEAMTERCLDTLRSGIAMNSETVDDILTVLTDDLKYRFTGNEGIRNREASIKIADTYGVLPKDLLDFFRYVIYRATGDTLLIKNRETIMKIKDSSYNPGPVFEQFGLEELAKIFNRFKPLFLAFKNRCPRTINAISKLSKTLHEPMVVNPLNNSTTILLTDSDRHWLDNATPFALMRLLGVLYSRAMGQDTFVYRIRNGKSWVRQREPAIRLCAKNFNFIINYVKERFDLSDRVFYIPDGIKYGLPTSEKMFVGNIPTGTKFLGNKLAVGLYWKNSWGARDLDVSGLNVGGKVGWNSEYSQAARLMYSGDITNAPNGAVEYLYASDGLKDPTLVMNNVFSGNPDSKYRVVIGSGDDVSRNYMMDPNNLIASVSTRSVQKQTVIGIFVPEVKGQSFTLLNFGAGNTNVSGNGYLSKMSTRALHQQWTTGMSFNLLVKLLGATIVNELIEGAEDLSVDALEKDTFTRIFK